MNQTPRISNTIPANYPLCLHADCPMADTCLHQLAFRRQNELGTYVRLINPIHCTKQQGCTHYAPSRPVLFAKGFKGFRKRMYPDQYDTFMTLLICHFGRNQYFKRRRGDVLLTPDEQDIVRAALERAGVRQVMDFDQYVEALQWVP